MAIQSKTRQIIETSIDRKQNFNRGNVSGKWEDKNHFNTRYNIGMLPRDYAKVLVEHSKKGDLFVVYSYQTPIAWYSITTENATTDLGSYGTGKWYYVDEKYSASTTGHQSAVRHALKGKNVVTLTHIFDTEEIGTEVAEMEKEYY